MYRGSHRGNKFVIRKMIENKKLLNINAFNFINLYLKLLLCTLLSIMIIGGCGPTLQQAHISDQAVQLEKDKQQEIAFDTYIKRQKRLFEISFPLLSAASSMNIDDVKQTCGFVFVTKDTFKKDYQEVSRRYFNLSDKPLVYYVQPKFPAEKAGLKPGDRIVNINGNALSEKKFEEVKAIIQQDQANTEKSVNIVVERDNQIMEFNIKPISCCKYNVMLVPDDSINAFSDGKNIIFTNGLVRFTENNDELAFVVAHEIAHNVMGHVSKKRGNVAIGSVFDVLLAIGLGVNTGGAFGKMGAAAYSKAFEYEADYAALYIAARAGYDVSSAPNFFRRMAAEHPKSTEKNFGASHPSNPERFIAMDDTVKEIKDKQKFGKALIPESKGKGSGGETGSLKENTDPTSGQ
jgi:membrane-associated protease RseP (regulator of RpoE activity)